ncbi:tetratricopeptide repeat protein [Streptomyces umbrinus]|uniref:tetratricopeptide repeat protein n=1 Tax=Streptomyces umbrinus TaxID=67370 RepID=UPI0027D7F643|nr:tetratricopeptide repeat protein [Streptomyces umbrinus]
MAQYGGVAAGRLQVQQLVVGAHAPGRGGAPVTLAPPLGERDPRFPLRGRTHLVEGLLELCDGGGGGRLHVVHGLGGCGKTAAVLEAVHQLHQRGRGGPAVWWIDARQGAVLEAGLRAVARQVGLRAKDMRGEDAADVLWDRLGGMPQAWILILDSVDDPCLLDGPGRLASGTGWVRPLAAPGGLVLLTSRQGARRSWGTGAVLHVVRPLGPADAAQVLLDRAGERAGPVSEARALAVRLGGLPLALHMAGSYLAEVSGMPGAFVEADTPLEFSTYRQALDAGCGRADPAQAVAGTWRLSLELMQQRGFPLAGRLLELLASFADAPIPHTLLLRPAALTRAVAEFERLDGTTLWRMLQELAALGLLELVTSPPEDSLPVVRLHPLIRDASRSGPQPGAALALLRQALEQLAPPEEPTHWSTWRALAPHALDLARQIAPAAQLGEDIRLAGAEAAELAARYLQACGLFQQARREYEQVLAVRRRLLGADHGETLSTRHNLAGALHDLGELVQARAEYEDVWAAWQRVEGAEHTHTLTARHELARVLHDQGELEQARQHFSHVLSARRRLQGDEHTHTLAARHELARVLHHQGELVQAQQEYLILLAVRRQSLGDEHPRTLTARHNLACVLQDLGELDSAQQELRTTWDTRSRVLGPEHPRTLSTQYKLACVLHGLGLAHQAHQLLGTALEASRRTVGESHPHTLRLATTLQAWSSGPS